MNKIDNIFVINLERSKDRKAHIIEEFKTQGINNDEYEFFKAIDYDSDMVKNMINTDFVKKFPCCFRCNKNRCKCHNNVLIPNQIGNWCSFIELMKLVINRDYKNMIMICEDDIKFTNQGYDNINKMLETNYFDKNIDLTKPLLIRLGAAKSKYNDDIMKLDLKQIVLMSNPAFMINKKFAESFINNLKNINHTSDVYIHKQLPELDKTIQHYSLIPLPIHDLSYSDTNIRYMSLIHPKGINEEDIIRMKNHIKRIEYKNFLCIGHPRCGTKSISQYLQQLGNYKIGHEKMNYNGISNWMMVVDDNYPFGIQIDKRRYYFKDIIHIVRNPYDAIPSIILENKYTPGNKSYKFKIKHINKHFNLNLSEEYNYNTLKEEVEIALITYLYWNELCEKINPTIVTQIENLQTLKKHLNINKNIDLKLYNSNKSYNGKKYNKPEIPLTLYKELNDELKDKLINFCNKYNYKYINE